MSFYIRIKGISQQFSVTLRKTLRSPFPAIKGGNRAMLPNAFHVANCSSLGSVMSINCNVNPFPKAAVILMGNLDRMKTKGRFLDLFT